MKRERLLNVLLLLAVIGLAAQLVYTQNKPPVHDVVTSVSPLTMTRSITNTVTGTVTLSVTRTTTGTVTSNVTKTTTFSDLPLLRERYPNVFYQNFDYDLFVSADVDTLPSSGGIWTYKNVTVAYEWYTNLMLTITHAPSSKCPSNVLVIATSDIPKSQLGYLNQYNGLWNYLDSCGYPANRFSLNLYLPGGQRVHYHLYLFLVTPS
jgi:hypothetical protein